MCARSGGGKTRKMKPVKGYLGGEIQLETGTEFDSRNMTNNFGAILVTICFSCDKMLQLLLIYF